MLFVSGQASNEVTTETLAESHPVDRRADLAERHRAGDMSTPRPPPGTFPRGTCPQPLISPPGTSSLQRQRVQQRQTSGPFHRDAADTGAILYDEEDVFVVGSPGGLFQSTTDPDVSIYVPPSAVTQTITLTMQVINSFEKDCTA